MFTQLEQRKIHLLTVDKTGRVTLTLQHNWIVNVGFMYYPGNYMGQTWAGTPSLEQCPIYIWQSWDFSCLTCQCIPGNKYTTSDRLIVTCETVGNPWNLQSCPAGFMLSIMYKLAATHSLLTWSSLYIPQDFPLLSIIIFLSYFTPANDGYTTTSARWLRIQSRLIDGRFIWYISPWHTARMQIWVTPPQCCKWSHRKCDRGCTWKNRL